MSTASRNRRVLDEIPEKEKVMMKKLYGRHKKILEIKSLIREGSWICGDSKLLANLLCENIEDYLLQCIFFMESEAAKGQGVAGGGEKPAEKAIAVKVETQQEATVKEILTAMPMSDDGFRWRKYGQMNLLRGHPHPRIYCKCLGEGCFASKWVQQVESDHESLFKVTYVNHHTCNPPEFTDECNFEPNINGMQQPHQPSDFQSPEMSMKQVDDCSDCGSTSLNPTILGSQVLENGRSEY